jgi:hypothetical protein
MNLNFLNASRIMSNNEMQELINYDAVFSWQKSDCWKKMLAMVNSLVREHQMEK